LEEFLARIPNQGLQYFAVFQLLLLCEFHLSPNQTEADADNVFGATAILAISPPLRPTERAAF
jgi:hypothetical protein